MRKNIFSKFLEILFFYLIFIIQTFGASEQSVKTLSEGACWFDSKESLKIASFNDKSTYSGTISQIELQLENLISTNRFNEEHVQINDMALSLHCGGYGASLVAKVNANGNAFCVWAKFDKGILSLRSLGAMNSKDSETQDLCEGHKWGEFIIGLNSVDIITELQSTRWSSIIKEISFISKNVYKISLANEYEFREQEAIELLTEKFNSPNLIRYIEYNEYRHPAGEFIPLNTNSKYTRSARPKTQENFIKVN